MAKITIDPDVCMASELCVGSHPDHVTFDDERGVAVPQGDGGELDDDAAGELVELCPAGAIHRIG